MLSITIFFITCNPGPAAHFAALGQSLDSKKYEVSYVAAGAGWENLKNPDLKAVDFNPGKLDLTDEACQMELANEAAKICSNAKVIIFDAGHLFFVHFQKALAQSIGASEGPLLIAYYDNPENFVPGYSEIAFEVIKPSQALFFANFNLLHDNIYLDKDQKISIDLQNIPRFGIGYFPLGQAKKLQRERLERHQEVRQKFLKSHGFIEKGQDILVYLGENNREYFDKTLPTFLDFLEEASSTSHDLANTIVMFQPHPVAANRQEELRLLTERNFTKNPQAPICLISHLNSNEALVLADVVCSRQSTLIYQIALAQIPYMQVGHEEYRDILVRNALCPSVTSASAFIPTFKQILSCSAVKNSSGEEKVLKGLGIHSNWAENFEIALQKLLEE